MASSLNDKKRKGGSAAKYVPEKRANIQVDPRRTKLHVNDPKSLRGHAMVLVTYDGHEGKATVEVHRLLAPFIEELSSDATHNHEEINPKEPSDGDSNTVTASDLLQQELDKLNADAADSGSKVPKMMTVRTNCKGVVMLRVGPKAKEEAGFANTTDIQTAINRVYESITESGSCSRLLVKLVPLQCTCFAGMEEIEAQLIPMIAQHFKEDKPCSYMVALKRRNNPKFDKDGMVNKIGEIVGPLHKVNLKDPEKVIIIEINQSLAGVTITDDGTYHRYFEYNIRKYQEMVRSKRTEAASV